MVVVKNNPYNNLYVNQGFSKKEKVITSKQACEEYKKLMKQKTKTFTFTK